jgi:hypothetical protein
MDGSGKIVRSFQMKDDQGNIQNHVHHVTINHYHREPVVNSGMNVFTQMLALRELLNPDLPERISDNRDIPQIPLNGGEKPSVSQIKNEQISFKGSTDDAENQIMDYHKYY